MKNEITDSQGWTWKEHKVNNIESNPLDCWYYIAPLDGTLRLYSIVPQYPADENGCLISETEPEYYILYEALFDKELTKEEQESYQYNFAHFDGLLFRNGSLVRVFKTMEDAQDRAHLQVEHISALINAYFGSETKNNVSDNKE